MAARVSLLYSATIFTTALLLCTYLYSPNLTDTQLTQTAPVKPKLIKHILLWTDPTTAPLSFLRQGSHAFTACEHTNCFVSHRASIIRSVSGFDAVLFNGRHLPNGQKLPKHRTAKQKYVFANMESSQNYPVCDRRFDGFFNWTWTYKLDSDSRWGYITVYNLTGHVIAPKVDMRWLEMEPVGNATKTLVASKRVAAAWFVSNCRTKSRREIFANEIAKELHRNGHSLHIYGQCGNFVCSRGNEQECYQMLAKKYYFYFAFENSLSEDYVTEKVLTALQHHTVPVVFGGANYSRFLPPGSYLDARELGARRLAARIASVIDNHRYGDGSLYHDFFRWRNHYTFRATAEKEDVCNICKLLNDPVSVSTVSIYRHFRKWWNSGPRCKGERTKEITKF